ncbi:MAG: deoxyguanosinetriphosphate triphosphohydrolase [Candidatus Margulisbacteria bacterium]|nr:deoxyguanosinetriphosphate triphosphohydrolase [Candidatus Margulisiibacteriota bacterium]
MFDRQYFENREIRELKPYAIYAKNSLGRHFSEEQDEQRTCFQRDRDRIVHSKAFRRLKHKTQVFVSHENDHFRTRLTHTLEVCQIARHLARVLGGNEDLVESIALAHDLGHTPFGHAGEEMLDELLVNHGGFEHNNQSKRVVELLENKYPLFLGLNLTVELLEGLMKHHTPFDNPQNLAEEDLIHPSMEAQIVNLADQLAYINHDLDDGLASGILDHDELTAEVELWREAQIVNEHKFTNLSDEQKRFLNVRYLINVMIRESLENSEKLISGFNIQTLEDVYRCDRILIDYTNEFKSKLKIMQKYLYDKFYSDYRVLQMSFKGKNVIKELFHYYLANSQDLPEEMRKKIGSEGFSLHRVIADHIALMTDNYVLSEHSRLVLGC